MYGGERGTYRVLMWKPEGKRQLRRPRHRWEHNIKIGWAGMDSIDLAEDRHQWQAVVNAVMNLWVP
jgi:hypothetical protein